MIRVVFNQKGGVGKSSITSNLAAVSAAHGFSTLLLDLDSQCNTTQYVLGADAEDPATSICQFFQGTLGFKSMRRKPLEYVQETAFDNLHIVPGHPELADVQAKLESRHKIYKLRDLLQDLSETYDRIYVDTPPAYNFYSLSALIAADRVLIPFDCDDFSRKALYTLIDNLTETRNDHNEELSLEGIVVNQFQPRASQPRRIVDELMAEGQPLLRSFLGSSVKMRESHEAASPLIYHALAHKLTQQFITLFEEMEGVAVDQEQLAIGSAAEVECTEELA